MKNRAIKYFFFILLVATCVVFSVFYMKPATSAQRHDQSVAAWGHATPSSDVMFNNIQLTQPILSHHASSSAPPSSPPKVDSKKVSVIKGHYLLKQQTYVTQKVNPQASTVITDELNEDASEDYAIIPTSSQRNRPQINNFPYSVSTILGEQIPSANSFPPGHIPIAVKVGLMINDLSGVDDLTGNISLTATMTQQWHDSRLKYVSSQYGPDGFVFIFAGDKAKAELEKIWQPYLRIWNEATSFNVSSWLLVIHPTGRVVLQQKFYATITTNLTVQKYPFVSQAIPVLVTSQLYDNVLVKLEKDPKMQGVYGIASSPYWRVAKHYTVNLSNLQHEKNIKAKFSTYNLTFEVSSVPTTFVLEVIFPLIALSLLASLLFWVGQFDHKRRMALGLTLLMSLIAYQYLMYRAIPRTSYVTFMNLMSVGSLIFIFATLLCIIVVEHIESVYAIGEYREIIEGVEVDEEMPRVTQILITIFKFGLPSCYLTYLLVICLVTLIP